jgi:hypothetical protein
MVMSAIVAVLPAAQGNRAANRGNRDAAPAICTMIADLPLQELSASEQAGLLFMREEEKLARDVYAALYGVWGLTAFENIGHAEQNHMDAIKFLLDRYGLADPAGSDAPGAFRNAQLQALYGEFVARGARSLVDALQAGAEIEDLDIFDLERAIQGTDNQDLGLVYRNLQKGSRNHLRAFSSLLEANGSSYSAHFIEASLLALILSSPHETGPNGADGRGCDLSGRSGGSANRQGGPATPPGWSNCRP